MIENIIKGLSNENLTGLNNLIAELNTESLEELRELNKLIGEFANLRDRICDTQNKIASINGYIEAEERKREA